MDQNRLNENDEPRREHADGHGQTYRYSFGETGSQQKPPMPQTQEEAEAPGYIGVTPPPSAVPLQAQPPLTYALNEPPKKKRGGRVALIALAAVLCVLLCFGAGAMGTLLMEQHLLDRLGNIDTDNKDNEAPGADAWEGDHAADDAHDAQPPQQGTQPSQTPGGSTPEKPSEGSPNWSKMPEIDKQPTMGDVSYAGSAGDNAYETLAEAVDMVNETVVEIFTETLINGGWLGNYVAGGAGSGVVISEEGYIVTNNHVVEGASNIQVRMTNGAIYEAQLVGTDATTDIAVLWVNAPDGLVAATLGCSADLVVGESVFAIGNPLGSLGGTVTNGIISATERSTTVDGVSMTLLQTNAAVNPGNSGGGLFNMAGELIGVVNSKPSRDNVEGLGFAIPVDTAYEVICQLIEYGYVRGVVDAGLDLYDVSSSNIMAAVRYFGMSHSGAYVMDSAYSEDILFGDLLLAVDDVAVSTKKEAEAAFRAHEIGDTVTLTLLRLQSEVRDDREYYVETKVTVELTLQEYVPEDVGIRFENAE